MTEDLPWPLPSRTTKAQVAALHLAVRLAGLALRVAAAGALAYVIIVAGGGIHRGRARRG